MPKKLLASSHGDVVPRLRDLVAVARATWGIPVSKRMVAKGARLNVKTVNDLFRQETTLYDLHTLWKLCWFFQCNIDNLLQWVPPGGSASAIPLDETVRVGSIILPRKLPDEQHLIRNCIPAKLEGVKIGEIVAATGLAENTVIALLNLHGPSRRFARATLAAVCAYLSQREGRPVAIEELLVYEGPADSQGVRQ